MSSKIKLKDKITEIKYSVTEKFKTNDQANIEKLINQKLVKIFLYKKNI